jgi:uncharacterized protein (TIGR03437 family)
LLFSQQKQNSLVDSQGNVVISTFQASPAETLATITKYSPLGAQVWQTSFIQSFIPAVTANSSGTIFVEAATDSVFVEENASSMILALQDGPQGTAAPIQTNQINLSFLATVMRATPNGGLIACGTAPPPPSGVIGVPKRPTPTCEAFDSNLNTLWMVTIGGSQGETLNDAVVDSSGNLYITGQTDSEPHNSSITPFTDLTTFPVTSGALNVAKGKSAIFVAKFDPSGNLLDSAVFGGSGDNYPTGIQVDAEGATYLTASSSAPDFPAPGGAPLPAGAPWLALKLNPSASQIEWATSLPSVSPGLPSLDAQGNLFVIGSVQDPSEFNPSLTATSYCVSFGYFGYPQVLLVLNPDGVQAMSAFVPGDFNGNATAVLSNQRGRVYSERGLPALPFSVFDADSLPSPAIFCVVDAADTFDADVIGPGEIISIHGAGIGPSQPATAFPVDGFYPTSLGGASVLIGGHAAPLLYAADGFINAVVPFEATDPLLNVQVLNDGEVTASINNAFGDGLYLFTSDNLSGGQLSALNQDGSVNSSTNPAAKGSIVTLFATGWQFPSPPPQDGSLGAGQINLASSFVSTAFQITNAAGQSYANIVSATDTPGQIEGLIEVKIQIPANLPGDGQLFVATNTGGYIFTQ